MAECAAAPSALHSKIADWYEESGLERNRTDDGGAAHQAPLRQGVIANRQVHRTRVVPHQEIADLPFVPIKKLGAQAVGVELGDQLDRLVLRHALDADALSGGDVKRLPPGVGVGAYDRMGDVGGLVDLRLSELWARAVGHSPARGVAVYRLETSKALLHALGERFVGGDRVGKDGVAERP